MSASAATRVSAIRCHHDADEVRDAVKFDRLRLMATYSRLYSVACDCCVKITIATKRIVAACAYSTGAAIRSRCFAGRNTGRLRMPTVSPSTRLW